MDRFILCSLYFLFFDVINGIELHGPNVCWKDVNGKNVSYCCFNHIPNNGTCTDCEDGTFSHEGGPCKPCSSNFYGNKCKLKCSCLIQERCDAKFGCVGNSIVMTTEAAAEVTSTIDAITLFTFTETDKPTDYNTHYYHTISGLMIVFSIVCFIFSIIICRKKSSNRASIERPGIQESSTRGAMTAQDLIPPSLPPIPITSQNIYETIDEIPS